MSDAINNQPTLLRNILKNQCTQQTNGDGTVSLFLAHYLPTNVVDAIKDEASVRIPSVGYFSKNGLNYGWTLRIRSTDEHGILCHFVFNDYTNVKR